MRIALINMPFSRVELPSLALTQLKSRLDEAFGQRVAISIHYPNMEFARWLGLDLHDRMLGLSMNTGLGEWFFRQAAFPDAPDTAEEFLARALPYGGRPRERLVQAILDRRAELPGWLEDCLGRLDLASCGVVGFTSMFSQNVASLAMAARIKAHGTGTLTAMGGANCEAPMGAALVEQAGAIDLVFSGPALVSFPEVVGHLLAGDPAACDRVPGVFTRTNVASQRRALGEELPISAPVPVDYDRFLADYDRTFPTPPAVPSVLFETSRGCWWGEKAHCTFCGLNGATMKFRFMPPEDAVHLIQGFYRHAPRALNLQSVDNILPVSYTADVLPALDTPRTMALFYEIKADIGPEGFAAFEKARVKFVQPGVEALSTATLKRMKKGTTAFHNIEMLKLCAMHDVNPSWNLLVGFPGEPASVYAKYAEDIPLLVHLPAPVGVAQVRFDRYSPYHSRPGEHGLNLRPFDFYGLTYPFPTEALERLAYYFVDDTPDAPYIADLAEWMDTLVNLVETWQMLWNNGDAVPAAQLHRLGDGDVLDSRSGFPERLRLAPEERQALDLLEAPLDRNRLAHAMGVDPERAGRILGRLRDARLLFEENGRALSLVLPGPPPSREFPLGARNPAATAGTTSSLMEALP